MIPPTFCEASVLAFNSANQLDKLAALVLELDQFLNLGSAAECVHLMNVGPWPNFGSLLIRLDSRSGCISFHRLPTGGADVGQHFCKPREGVQVPAVRACLLRTAGSEQSTEDVDMDYAHRGIALVTAQLDVRAIDYSHDAAATIDARDHTVRDNRKVVKLSHGFIVSRTFVIGGSRRSRAA